MPPSAVSDMYSEWTSLVQKIESDRRHNVSVLSNFPEGVGKDVAASVVKSLVQSPSSNLVLPSTLNSDDQVKWTMEVVGFGLTLPFTEYEIIRDCVTVECDWLTALTAPKGNVPTPVVEDPNHYAREVFLHLYYLFVPRSAPAKSRPHSGTAGSNPRQSAASPATSQLPAQQQQHRQDLIKHQAVLCHRVLRTVQTIAVESNLIDAKTWESILCFLLAANDALLSPPTVKEDIGDQLGERIVSVLFDVWLLACGKSFPSPSLWKTLKELCCHWRHHASVIDQWNKTTSRLTGGVLTILYGPDFPEFKRFDDVEDRFSALAAMNHETLVQTWFRFIHVLTDPADLSKPEVIADTPKFIHSAITDKMCPQDHTQHPCLQKLPLIFYNAIRSIANIADAFLGIYDPAIDQLHRDFILHNSANPGISIAAAAGSLHQSMADLTGQLKGTSAYLAAPTTPPNQRKSSRSQAPASAGVKKTDRMSKTVLTATSSSSLSAGSSATPSSSARPANSSSLQAAHLQSQQSSGSAGSPADLGGVGVATVVPFPHLSTINGGSASYFPIRATCNSIFHLLGSWLFEAALVGCHLHPAHENLKIPVTRRTPSFLDQGAGGTGSSKNPASGGDVFDSETSTSSSIAAGMTTSHEASPPLPKSLAGSGYEAGRAEAVAAICRILCSRKTKEEILPTYLARSYLVLYYGLQLEQDPSGQVLSALLTSGVDLLRTDLDGIFILIPHFLMALELILPESTPRFKGHEMISQVELRRSAIHLLLSMLCLPLHFRDLPLNDITATAFLTADSDFHSASFFGGGGGGKEGGDGLSADSTFGALRLKLVNLLIQALHTETDSVNIHMLLGGLLIVVQDSAIFESVSSAPEVPPTIENRENTASTSTNGVSQNNNNNNNENGNNPNLFHSAMDPPSTNSSVSINIPERNSSASTYSSRPASSSTDHHFDADFLNPNNAGSRPQSGGVTRPTRGSTFSGSSSSPFPGGERQSSRLSTSQQRSVFESQFSSDPSGDGAVDFFGCAVKVIQAKLNKSWKSDLGMSLSALEVLCGLSKVSLTLSPVEPPRFPRNDGVVDHYDDEDDDDVIDELAIQYKTVVKFVCSYIEEQCSRPPQYHSRDLHSMIVAAYQCLSTWIVDHPRILEDAGVLQTLLETIELGISGAKSRGGNGGHDGKDGVGIMKAEKPLRPASMRVREAAESVLSVVLDHAGSFPSPCGPESLSSLLDEESLLRQCGDVDDSDDAIIEGSSSHGGGAREAAIKHFRYFVIDNAYIVGLFEQPLANEQDPLPTVTVILRGCRGKHVWTMQLRHLPRNLSNNNHNRARGSRTTNAVVARPHPETPLVQPKPQPRRWWPELVDAIPEVNADKSIPTLEDVLRETDAMEEHLELVKLLEEQAAFEESVAETYERETALVRSTSPTLLDPSLECKAPPVTHEFQTARLFLSHFGFLSQGTVVDTNNGGPGVTANPKVLALDSTRHNFAADFEHLDALPSRTVDTAFVFYVKAGQRTAEEILSNANHADTIHPHFYQMINSLGWPVDVAQHAGWTGNVVSSWKVLRENPFLPEMTALSNPRAHLYDGVENVLYYGDINSEVAFLTPSLHSADILRASLSRRASDVASGSFHGPEALVKTTSATSSLSSASGSSVTASTSSTSSSAPRHGVDIPSVIEPQHRNSLTDSGNHQNPADGANHPGAGSRNPVASNVLLASNKKNKFFAGKPERHKSEAVFDANVALKTPSRPAHSVIGDGFEGKSVAGINQVNGTNNNASKRPLSLELDHKTTEAVGAGSTATTTSTNARGYREIISPSTHPAGSHLNASNVAETPRNRRAGKREMASLAALDTKVMIVWLQSYEDRTHFPTSELLHGHCLTGAEPYVGRSSMADAEGANGSMADSNLYVIFVHPLQNGLFRVNIQAPPTRPALAIPVVGGMVLSRRLLGITIRQTVVNICQRKRLDDADVNQPPHVKRRYKIQEITSKYHEEMADPEFLTALFKEVPRKVVN